MFEGLYPYEKLLAVLGTALFVVLAVVLLVYVFQRRGVSTLLPFFLLPVVMIGFPGIQKVSYENGKLELEKALAGFERSSNDSASRAQLRASVEKIAPRTATDPKASLTAARAFAKLGEPDRALRSVRPSLEAQPTRREALDLQRELLHRNPSLEMPTPDRGPSR